MAVSSRRLQARPSIAGSGRKLGDGEIDSLRGFTSRYRVAIEQCGIRALELCADTKNAEENVFELSVRRKAGKRWNATWELKHARAVSYGNVPQRIASYGRQLVKSQSDVSRSLEAEKWGTFLVLIKDVDSDVCYQSPMRFDPEKADSFTGPWKEALFSSVNDGLPLPSDWLNTL